MVQTAYLPPLWLRCKNCLKCDGRGEPNKSYCRANNANDAHSGYFAPEGMKMAKWDIIYPEHDFCSEFKPHPDFIASLSPEETVDVTNIMRILLA